MATSNRYYCRYKIQDILMGRLGDILEIYCGGK